jgi:hypothetical protein
MKPLLILTLLIAPLVVARGDPAPDKFDLRFSAKDHLTASQLYQLGSTAKAIDKIIGQLVLLDVVVTMERNVPLAEVVPPKELAGDSAHPVKAVRVHLISATSEAPSLKKGGRFRIEGIIVDEGFNAYTIYLLHARMIK